MTNEAKRSFTEDGRGVSSIVGVAIMVGLTVALAGLIGVTVFNIGQSAESEAGATAEFDQSGDDVTVIVDDVDSEVSELDFRGNASSSDNINGSDLDVGATYTINNQTTGDRIIVVAISEDGTENRVGQYEVTDAAETSS